MRMNADQMPRRTKNQGGQGIAQVKKRKKEEKKNRRQRMPGENGR